MKCWKYFFSGDLSFHTVGLPSMIHSNNTGRCFLKTKLGQETVLKSFTRDSCALLMNLIQSLQHGSDSENTTVHNDLRVEWPMGDVVNKLVENIKKLTLKFQPLTFESFLLSSNS